MYENLSMSEGPHDTNIMPGNQSDLASHDCRNQSPKEMVKFSRYPQKPKSPFLSEDLRRRILQRAEIYVKSAIAMGNLATLKDVYKFARVTTLDKDGNTALHYAAMQGDHVLLRWLFKNAAVRVTARNRFCENCAHTAVKHGHLTCLRYIIYCGEFRPVVIAWERDANGMTLLHLAAFGGHLDIVCWLLDTFGKALGLITNKRGQTPLHLAASKGHVSCLGAICRVIGSEINAEDDTGATATFYAAQGGHVQCLYFLVETAHADPLRTTHANVTPLMAAAQLGRIDMVNFLLQKTGDDALAVQTLDGATVFHMAAANGREDVLEFLLTRKASRDLIHLVDKKGSSPAHDAAEYGHVGCLQRLLTAGLDVMLKDQDGESPYSLALRHGSSACAAFVRTFTGGEELDANSLERSLRATVAADASQMDFGKDIQQGTATTTINIAKNGRKDKISKNLLVRLKEMHTRSPSKSDGDPPPVIKGEFILQGADIVTEGSDTSRQADDQPRASTSSLDVPKPSDTSSRGTRFTKRKPADFQSQLAFGQEYQVADNHRSMLISDNQKPSGAKYVTIVFSDGSTNRDDDQSLEVNNQPNAHPISVYSVPEPVYSVPVKKASRLRPTGDYRPSQSPTRTQFAPIPEISSSMEELDQVVRVSVNGDRSEPYDAGHDDDDLDEYGSGRDSPVAPPVPPPLPPSQPHSFAKAILKRLSGRIAGRSGGSSEYHHVEVSGVSPASSPTQRRRDCLPSNPHYDRIFSEFQDSPIYKRMRERNQGTLEQQATGSSSIVPQEGDDLPEDLPGSEGARRSPQRKRSIKFTYLPDGNLKTPRLRHVQFSPDTDMAPVIKQDIDEADLTHLHEALVRRMKSPFEIPKVNMKKVRQYEKLPDPPSELELFFKNRHERLRKITPPESIVQEAEDNE